MSPNPITATARHRRGRPTMAAEPGHQPADAERAADLGTTQAVLGVVTVLEEDSLTVHVRRGGPVPDASAGHLVTYRVGGTRVYKGARRTTLDEIAVGDLVLVHSLVVSAGDQHPAVVSAARIHGLTPSRRALGA
jgi:hypothetical protein